MPKYQSIIADKWNSNIGLFCAHLIMMLFTLLNVSLVYIQTEIQCSSSVFLKPNVNNLLLCLLKSNYLNE